MSLGFAIFEKVLSRQECDALANAVAGAVDLGRAGVRNLMSNPAISSLAYDSRLMNIAAGKIGSHAVPFRATLFDKSEAANWHVFWHQDRALPLLSHVPVADWGPWSQKCGVQYALAPAWALEHVIALRVHIDAASDNNGPLRVIPGSHTKGVICREEILRTVNAVPARACLIACGGVLAMRPLLLHSSQKVTNNQPRRVLHIEYADCLDFGIGVQLCVT